ncbi:MAG: transporter related protein [Solirubrobacterales bacterium]|nr:transporter related protein [Solirubrobacterales bacterium]
MTTSAVRLAVEDALASPDPAAQRLRYADTSVAFCVEGPVAERFTLLLDRQPAAIVDGDDAEVQIVLTSQQAARFSRGDLPMPAAVIAGEVLTQGPVRKYLEVDPVLRRLLQEADASQSTVRIPRPGAPASIPSELLAIETRNLHKSFGDNAVLAGLDVTIPEGVISVVLGPSGTGKSVLLQHIIGLLRPDAGEVLIRGQALGDMNRSDVIDLRRQIGVMFQDGALFSSMTVFENVAFPLRQHTDFNEAEVRELVEDHLASVGLSPAAHRRPNELSGGMRKRAGLARALVLNPGIVLCDEPDSGLDPVRTALLGELLVDQHARCGGTMVMVTHNIALARQTSDHISVVWRGRVLESGLTEDVFASERPFVRQFLAGATAGPLGMDV